MKKRWLAALAAALICTSCAPVSEEPDVTNLSWYLNFSWYTASWGQNAVSQAITEKTGINVSFQVPAGTESETLDALISRNQLTDLVTLGWWEPQTELLVRSGSVYAYDELAEQYCPEFFEYAGQAQLDWYTQPDGHVYAYPSSSTTPKDCINGVGDVSNQCFLVRKDIYEALGCPDMTTPEGFMQAVRDAAQLFPETENGPLIPIGLHEFTSTGCYSLEEILQSFLAIPYQKDGAYYDRFTDPDYIAWLKVFRQLQEEGYLTSDVFLDKRAQMSEKIEDGRYFCLLYQRSDMADQQKVIYQEAPERVYLAVDGPRNLKGDEPNLSGIGINGWTLTYITRSCEHPDKAISFVSFLLSEEGQKLTALGIEGEHYTWEDGKAVFIGEADRLYRDNYAEYVRQIGADNTYWMFQNDAMQRKWYVEQNPVLLQMERWCAKYTRYIAAYEIRLPFESFAETAEASIDELWGATLPQLLLAESDEEFDAIFENFLTRREELGFEEVAAVKNQLYEENWKKLGLKQEETSWN